MKGVRSFEEITRHRQSEMCRCDHRGVAHGGLLLSGPCFATDCDCKRFTWNGPDEAAKELRFAAIAFVKGMDEPPVDYDDSACAARNKALLAAAVKYTRALDASNGITPPKPPKPRKRL